VSDKREFVEGGGRRQQAAHCCQVGCLRSPPETSMLETVICFALHCQSSLYSGSGRHPCAVILRPAQHRISTAHATAGETAAQEGAFLQENAATAAFAVLVSPPNEKG